MLSSLFKYLILLLAIPALGQPGFYGYYDSYSCDILYTVDSISIKYWKGTGQPFPPREIRARLDKIEDPILFDQDTFFIKKIADPHFNTIELIPTDTSNNTLTLYQEMEMTSTNKIIWQMSVWKLFMDNGRPAIYDVVYYDTMLNDTNYPVSMARYYDGTKYGNEFIIYTADELSKIENPEEKPFWTDCCWAKEKRKWKHGVLKKVKEYLPGKNL